MPVTDCPRIAAVLHEDSLYTRSVLRGVHSYSLGNNWLLHLARPEADCAAALGDWQPRGVIAHADDHRLVDSLQALGCPVVNVANSLSPAPFASVVADDHEVGRLAAEHLLAGGFEKLAFIGFRSWRFSQQRGEAFRRKVGTGRVEVLERTDPATAARQGISWAMQEAELVRWLQELPRPTGIFAANDYLALDLINACRRCGLDVPDDISVIGVDNDELLCELAAPPLSSIAIPMERIGHEAAALLERLMRGDDTAVNDLRLPPLAVIPRQSSDRQVVADPVVSTALRYISDCRGEPINVEDVLYHVSVSRRTLERAFREHVGRTPLQEIRRVHLEHAKALLTQSELNVGAIAMRAGFSDGKHLATVFKKEVGMTPVQFRQQGRLPTKSP